MADLADSRREKHDYLRSEKLNLISNDQMKKYSNINENVHKSDEFSVYWTEISKYVKNNTDKCSLKPEWAF